MISYSKFNIFFPFRTNIVPKLGEVAMELQEVQAQKLKEEEAKHGVGHGVVDDDDDDSQDMFESTQPLFNPLIRAGMQAKQQQPSKNSVNIKSTQENRNPFAKRSDSLNGSIDCSPGSGIVFDNPASAKPLLQKKTVLIAKKVKLKHLN